jgi:hypothetical protein
MPKIIFSTNEMLFAKAIRYVTKSSVSHVAFLYSKELISHSTFIKGVSLEPLREFCARQNVIAVYDISDNNFELAKKLFEQKNNSIYGYFDILYIALSVLLKRIIRFKNPLQDGLVCSEYVSLYIDMCYGTKLNSSSYPPTPEDLLEWCEKNLTKIQY